MDIITLNHCNICVCINMFVNIISMVTVICLCTSYDLLLGCATSWESCHAYLLYIICYSIVVILVDLHSKKWMNISLFELVVKCIEIHIFVPSFSTYHIFLSIIKFFSCFSLLLGQLFTLNLIHPKTCIQYNIYSIFDQISSFSCFTFRHIWLQRMTLITRKGVFTLHLSGKEDVCIGIGSRDKVYKQPHCICCQACRDW